MKLPLKDSMLKVSHEFNFYQVIGYKYIFTPFIQVGWYLSENLSVNLNVHLNYGFIMASWPPKNLINKLMIFWYC